MIRLRSDVLPMMLSIETRHFGLQRSAGEAAFLSDPRAARQHLHDYLCGGSPGPPEIL